MMSLWRVQVAASLINLLSSKCKQLITAVSASSGPPSGAGQGGDPVGGITFCSDNGKSSPTSSFIPLYSGN